AYLGWRDATIELLEEAAARLGIADGPLLTMARRVIRVSCDTSLVRMMRRFDTTRQTLEALLQTEQAKLAHQALHDPLTNLPNRLLFSDRLAHALASSRRRGQQVAVLFLDLDYFKRVNDGAGHLVGDRVLVTVAERLLAVVRPADTVARLGGDEFVVLAEDLDDAAGAARELAARIARAMREPISVDGHELVVTASIGMALADAESDPAEVLAHADAAMYEAKRRGRDRHTCFSEIAG
ncbi:MAG TPA: GGDEF domain-containing protein, partial [Candidatus Dormibacteraeota bacterium]|nr:GGDEF domain-containing protein [Candidatus Dormibacteraeota bacterium]